MKTVRRSALAFFAAMFVLGSALAAMADPPGRVARIDYMTGGVSVQPGGVKDWVSAELNRPLTSADRVWTDKDSRAELHLGTAYMRMSSETSITLTNLSDQTVQVELDQGTLNLRIRHLYGGEIYEIDTPNLAFTVTKSGEYRFDVDPNGDVTWVTARKGEGEATGEGRAVKVRSGDQARFSGGTSLSHNIQEAPDRDGFDDWCRVRDRRQESYASYRYVSPYVIGADDLDDYGTWRTVPSYGPIWVPAVAPGWAPYRYGHWIWLDPWGWTWVDDAPWGFAPCHYGRWVHYGGYWGWAPGPVIVRPVYAPALVAWVGGDRWGVSFSFGGPRVGWFPLGYGEPYVPPYYVSRNYFRNVNVNNTRITNVTNITNIYNNTYNTTNHNIRNSFNNTDNSINVRGNHNKVVMKYANRDVPGAVTAVPKDVMANSRPVHKAALQVSERDVKGASIGMVPSVAPNKLSVLGGGERSSMPPAQIQRRPVVSKLTPPQAPLPFSAKQQALAERSGRPLDVNTERELRAKFTPNRGTVGEADRPVPEMTRGNAPPATRAADANQPRTGAPARNVPRPPDRTINGRGQADIEDRNVPRSVDRSGGPDGVGSSSAPTRTVPRPPDKTYTGRQPGSVKREVPIPSSTDVDNPRQDSRIERTVPRPPDRTYTGGQRNSARDVPSPRQSERAIDSRQDTSRPIRNVPRPGSSTVQEADRDFGRPAGGRSMPVPATPDRPSNIDRPNMDRSNVDRSVNRNSNRPMMDSPRREYPRAESRSMPTRDVYESRRVESRPADSSSVRTQREPSAVHASPSRQSSDSGRGQQSRGDARNSNPRK